MARIMVIDDDDLFRMLVRMHLQAAGHKILLCEDGEAAIRSIFAELPDLVVLDLGMPFLDGFELLKALRGDPLTRRIPVIVCSAFRDTATLDKVTASGASEFLNKPVSKEMLIEAVEKHLAANRAQPGA